MCCKRESRRGEREKGEITKENIKKKQHNNNKKVSDLK